MDLFKNIHLKCHGYKIIVALTILFFSSFHSHAQEESQVTRILFILDASGSMQNLWEGKKRMDIAKEILLEIVEKLDKDAQVQVGLRVYGHQFIDNCQDTKLEVGFTTKGIFYFEKALKEVRSRGATPISYALEKSGGDFPPNSNARNIIILITDGLESCNGDPCAVSKALQEKNIFLRPFIIGLGLSESESAFDCVGTFYNVTNTTSFKKVFHSIVDKTLSKTTLRVDLLDVNNKASETNVNMTFSDALDKTIKYNYYHTKNVRGQSDVLTVDPIYDYDIKIHTTPPVIKENISITPGEENVAKIKSPQGFLTVKLNVMNQTIDNKVKCLVRKSGSSKTIDVLDANNIGKYLVGKYDVEILTLPRILLKDVQVNQSKTTTLQIPSAGLLSVLKEYIIGAIYVQEGDEFKEIYQMNTDATRETIALQPGKYKIIAKSKYAKTAEATIEKSFELNSGSSLSIKL